MSTPRLLRTSADAKPVPPRLSSRSRASSRRRLESFCLSESAAPGHEHSACQACKRVLVRAAVRPTSANPSPDTRNPGVRNVGHGVAAEAAARSLAISAWSESIRRCLSRQSRRLVARSAASSRTACASRSRSTASPAFSPVLTAALCCECPWARVAGGGTTRWAISGDCDSQHNDAQPFKGIGCTTR